MEKKKVNVCYFHRQDDNKWEWFIADNYGRSLIKCTKDFDTYEEVSKDYADNGHKLEVKLDFGTSKAKGPTIVNGKPIE